MTKTMAKRLFLILPLMAMLFISCDKTVSLEQISMSYKTPNNGVIPATGGDIVIYVESTHSFQLSSPSSEFSFLRDGIVNYSAEGVAIMGTNHTVGVAPNETGEERQMYIEAKHLHNPNISMKLEFIQPAKESE